MDDAAAPARKTVLFLCTGNSCRSQLTEVGIEVRGARSKPVGEFRGRSFDLAVTVCSQAAEQCPVWLGGGKRVHQEYPDPAKTVGEEEQVLAAFRWVRDAMLRDLPALLQV